MNKAVRDAGYLYDIQTAIGKIKRYTTSMLAEDFMTNELVQDACIRNLVIVGEAVTKLSPELKRDHSDIPWSNIAGMRHRLVHAYNGTNLKLLWNTIVLTLPEFSSQIDVIQDSLNH